MIRLFPHFVPSRPSVPPSLTCSLSNSKRRHKIKDEEELEEDRKTGDWLSYFKVNLAYNRKQQQLQQEQEPRRDTTQKPCK